VKRLKRWLAIILMGAVAHLLVPWSVPAQRTEEEQKAEDVQKQAEEAQKAFGYLQTVRSGKTEYSWAGRKALDDKVEQMRPYLTKFLMTL